MKCTDNSSKSRRARNKRNKRKKQIRNRWVACLSVILMIQCIAAVNIYKDSNKTEALVQEYETSNYTKTLYRGQLFAENLCTASEDIPLSVKSSDTGSDSVSENASAAGNPLGFEPESVHAVGLFDVNNAETDCAYNIHKKIYPASTTKLILVNLQQMNRHVASKQEISSHWKIC